MKSFVTILGVGLISTGAFAERAIVTNKCAAPIDVRSFHHDGSISGPVATLQPNGTFSEDLQASGSTIKIDTDRNLGHPLILDYSFTSNPDYIYYELNSEWGNPFGKRHNILTPGTGCEPFDCAAYDGLCYSREEAKKVYSCPAPANLTLTLCL